MFIQFLLFVFVLRFIGGSDCWSNTDNRECWGDFGALSSTCCLDSLYYFQVLTVSGYFTFFPFLVVQYVDGFCALNLMLEENSCVGILIFLPQLFFHRSNRFDAPLKVAFSFALPALFGIWLGLSITGSVLVGVGYGFFTPWVSAFEAFRHDDESKKFFHCIVVKF